MCLLYICTNAYEHMFGCNNAVFRPVQIDYCLLLNDVAITYVQVASCLFPAAYVDEIESKSKSDQSVQVHHVYQVYVKISKFKVLPR